MLCVLYVHTCVHGILSIISSVPVVGGGHEESYTGENMMVGLLPSSTGLFHTMVNILKLSQGGRLHGWLSALVCMGVVRLAGGTL